MAKQRQPSGGVVEISPAAQALLLNAIVKFRGPFTLTAEETTTEMYGAAVARHDEKTNTVTLTWIESAPPKGR